MLKITEIKIGDILCSIKTKFPMEVVAIYKDGSVFLDFEENEGDVFEYNINELEFSDKILKKS